MCCSSGYGEMFKFLFFAVIDSFNQRKGYFFLHHKSVICQCLDMREKMILVFRIYNEIFMIHILIYTFWVYFKFMPRYEPCVIYIYVYTAFDILVIL